ncbi:MAG: helicase-associated domain-containing protein [Treponema sp.]|jgi:hypothetical protein|nr:helicase-associated domain-containing protein [Treponema sp.]
MKPQNQQPSQRERLHNRPLFRSPEEWKSAILTLPDNAYFDLLRSIFGNIKTPFNKHKLMEDLGAFLTRREIQEAIAAYIGPVEHRIISAIALLGEPAPGELESFFAGEYSFVELHGLLLNLEERLIVYRFRDESAYHLALNPLLEPVLAPFAARAGELFFSFPVSDESQGNGYAAAAGWDGRIFAALLSFFTGEEEFFKAEGGIRKKALDDGKRLFPGLNLETLSGGLLRLGLLQSDGRRVFPVEGKARFFMALNSRERLEYWAVGVYLYLLEGGTGYFSRGRVQATARFIRRFTGALEEGRSYPRKTLLRLANLVNREVSPNSWGVVEPAAAVFNADRFDALIEAMETAKLLTATLRENWIPAPDLFHPRQEGSLPENSSPVIAMDTVFSCILYPEISFTDALFLASFCSVRETGAVVRFELTRESAVRGFDRNLDAGAMIRHLERLSGKSVDQSLLWTLTDWESRYAAVSLHQGTVLSLAEDRRYLAETGPLALLIARTLAPGIYLLRDLERHAVLEALNKAGVDIVAQPPLPDPQEDTASPYPSLEGCRFWGQELIHAAKENPGEAEEAAAYQERFRRALAGLSLPKAERDELAARIERRLILTESQLAEGAVRFEKLEAWRLDYVGKTLVAKQAISSKSLVEIAYSVSGARESRIFGTPDGLEKQGGESILILKPLSDESGEPIRVPLGKISQIRRIKKSIFGE